MLLHDLDREQDHGEQRRKLRRLGQAESVLHFQAAFAGGAFHRAAAKIEERGKAPHNDGHRRERHDYMRQSESD